MTRRLRFLIISLFMLLPCYLQTGYALQLDDRRLQLAAEGAIPWQSLSPEEQNALKEYRGRWNQYNTDKQFRLRDGAQRWQTLSPDEKKRIREKRRQYRNLSPEEQKRLRDEYQRKHR